MKSNTKLSLKLLFGIIFLIIFFVGLFGILTIPALIFPELPTPPIQPPIIVDSNISSADNTWFDNLAAENLQERKTEYLQNYQKYQSALKKIQNNSNNTQVAIAKGTELSFYLILSIVLLRSVRRQLKQKIKNNNTNNFNMEYLKDQKYVLGVIAFIIILGLYFYWYGYRPAQIKQDCYSSIFKTDSQNGQSFINQALESRYRGCLAQHGL